METGTINVFVSSTWLDLKPERQALEAALQRFRETKYVGMEYFGSRSEDTRTVSLDEIDRCQVYVGIFGERYGSGITEAEYRRARDQGLCCFVYFKDPSKVAPEGREADPAKAEQLESLKAELRQARTVSNKRFANPDELATQVSIDLHNWLFKEYVTPRLEAGGCDAIQSLFITGDPNQVFAGGLERLRDAYIPPWPVFERVRLDDFVGREWLIAEIDAFLSEKDRGLFVLEADAGVGKTAFLAHLVRERDYVHHFVELAPGQAGIAAALRNLAAQLALAWKLDPAAGEGVLPKSAERSHYLQNLLAEAARKRDETRPGEKIVLVVDGLDEAGVPPDPFDNVLGLPRVLPAGVYLIVSHRPVAVRLRLEGPRAVFSLKAQAPDNLDDMRGFLEAVAARESVRRALAESSYSAREFVEVLMAKCRGVWIYLHYVVQEIGSGERAPLALETLPDDLWEFYAHYWERWRSGDLREKLGIDWEREALPLLSVLAAVREAVPASRVARLAEVSPEGVENLLRQEWRPFMAVRHTANERRYRFYHASLRQFFSGRIDSEALPQAERSFAEDLAASTRRFHGRIADHYLSAWGGLDTGLADLERDRQRSELDDGYGLRHLAAHLAEAGRSEDLHQLLAVEWRQAVAAPAVRRNLGRWLRHRQGRESPPSASWCENAWFAMTERSGETEAYIEAVGLAWRWAEERTATQEAVGDERPPADLGLQCRYGLITASLNSRARSLPASLLVALMDKGIWSSARSLAQVRRISDPARRRKVLDSLAGRLAQRGEAAKAIEALQAIDDAADRTASLKQLAPVLPQPFKSQALTAATAAAQSADGDEQAALLEELVRPLLDLGECREALAAAQAIREPRDRDRILTELSQDLARLRHPELALEAASSIRDRETRINVLRHLAAVLPAPNSEEAVRRIATAIGPSAVEEISLITLLSLISTVPEPVRGEAFRCAVSFTLNQPDPLFQALSLVALAFFARERYLGKILHEIRKLPAGPCEVEGEEYPFATVSPRACALTLLAVCARTLDLPEGKLEDVTAQALTAVNEVAQPAERLSLLLRLAPELTGAAQDEALRRALATAEEVADSGGRLVSLLQGIPHVADDADRDPTSFLEFLSYAGAGGSEPAPEGAHSPWQDENRLAVLWAALNRFLSESERQEAPAAIFEAADRLPAGEPGDEIRRIGFLAEMIGALRGPRREEALIEAVARARKIRDEISFGKSTRIEALWKLVERSEGAGRRRALDAVLESLREIREDGKRAEVVMELLPRLAAGEHLGLARAAARMLPAWNDFAESPRTDALLRLAALVSGPEQQQLVGDLLEVITAVEESADASAETLPRLIHRMLGTETRSAEVGEAREESLRPFLANMADRFPVDLLVRALESTTEIFSSEEWAEAVCSLVTVLVKRDHLKSVLAVARKLPEERFFGGSPRFEALAALLPLQPPSGRGPIVRKAMAALRAISKAEDKVAAIVRLAPHLPPDLLEEACTISQSIEEQEFRIEALEALAPHLGEPQLRKILAEVQAIGDENELERALAAGEPGAAVRERVRSEGSEAFEEIAPALPEGERREILREELARTRSIDDAAERARAISDLAPALSEAGIAEEALVDAQTIAEDWWRTVALLPLAGNLPKSERDGFWRQALESARANEDQVEAAEMLAAVAAQLEEPEKGRLLDKAFEMADALPVLAWPPSPRAEALSVLALRLAELGCAQRAVEAASAAAGMQFMSQNLGVRTLRRLARRLADLGHLDAALEAARTIGDDFYRAETLTAMAPHLPEETRGQLREEALDLARGLEDGVDRVRMLAVLSRQFPEEVGSDLLKEALETACRIDEDQERETSLELLAPSLARFAVSDLGPLWCKALHRLAGRTRRQVLADLCALEPVMAALRVGPEIRRAVRDVGRWWP